MPTFSIVIPTRDRPGQIVDCIRSALLDDAGLVEVLVIDQSTTDDSERLLRDTIDDARLKVIRTPSRGVAAARNVGFTESRGEVILCTDDDCRVPNSWLSDYRAALEANEDIDVAYGGVVLPADVPEGSFAARFESRPELYKGRLPGPHDPWGISANMAIRRRCLQRFGLFDELLGAGGRFGSGAETDYTIRVIAGGGAVAHVEGAPVLHLGLRSAADAAALVRRYGFGLGAMAMKHLRLSSRPGRRYLLDLLIAHGRSAIVNMARRTRPSGARFALAIGQGAWASRRVPLDKSRGTYVRDAHG